MFRYIVLICMMAISSFAADQFDWPVWRGPDGNSVSKEKNWNPKALNNLKVLWKKDIGQGYSQVFIKGNYLLTMGNVRNNNIIYCMEPATGKIHWTYKYPCKATNRWVGNLQTPIIFNDNVYVISRESDMFCFNLKDGKVIWKKNVEKVDGVEPRHWGYGNNIKTYGKDKLFLNTGARGFLYDANTGKLLRGEKGDTRYGLPVFYKKNNQDHALMWGVEELMSIDMKTGKKDWSHRWVTEHDLNAADQLILPDDRIFISSGYKHGCAMLQVKNNKVKVLWQNKNMSCHFPCPLYFDGYIYGVSGQAFSKASFVCLEAKTGKIMWKETLGFGNYMVADNKFIFNSERGKLHIFEVNPKKYVEISSVQTELKKVCWGMPILCRAKIYAKSRTGMLICVDVSE
jgi:outer membrane protein assembly factor BamB